MTNKAKNFRRIEEEAVTIDKDGKKIFVSEELKQKYCNAFEELYKTYTIKRAYEKYCTKTKIFKTDPEEVRKSEIEIIEKIFEQININKEGLQSGSLNLYYNHNTFEETINKNTSRKLK